MKWYLLDPTTNQPVGPYYFEDIKTYIKTGQVSKDSLAAREGDSDWHPLCEFTEFKKPQTHWSRAAGIGCLSALGVVIFLIILITSVQDNNKPINTTVHENSKNAVKGITPKVHIPKFRVFKWPPMYEIGGMARAVQRIEVLDHNTNKAGLRALLMERYNFLKGLGTRYNDHVTNVFIYVYDSEATCDSYAGGANWICMLSKTGDQYPIDIRFNQERLNAFLHPR